MAVHLLFRPAPAAPPPTPVSPVRRSARLGPHSSTPPSLSGPSPSPTKPAASPSAKQRAAKGHISPIPNARKRARPSEPQPQLHLPSDESDSELPSAHATAATTPLVAPLTPGPTPRSIRAQKRQKVSSTTDAEHPPADQGPTTSSLTPLTPTTVPKTRAAKRKSLVIDDDGEANTLLQEPEPLPTPRASKRKRNENAPQPASPLVRSPANGRKAKLKATPLTTTMRGRASSQVQLTGDNNLPHVKSTKGKERAREDDILPGPIPNPKVVSLRSPRRSAGGVNSTDVFASSSILAGPSSVHGLNSKNDISSPLPNTTATPQPYSKDVPRTTRTTRAKARELLSLESNESMMLDTVPTSTTPTSASSSPRLGPLTQTMGIVLNTNILSLALNQAPTIASSKPNNSSQTSEPPSQTTKSTGRQPHIHFHSPLTPLAHTTSTTPPGSPTLSARVSPPLDAIDLGLVLGGGGEGGGSSTSTNNSAPTSPTTSVSVATLPSSTSASSSVKSTTSASDLNTPATPVSGGLFPNPILLPSIPTAAAAFLGAQEMPEQQRSIQPFNFPPTSPTEELGAPPPSPAAHVQTHPLPTSSSSSTSAPEAMNIARDILDVGFQEAAVDISGIPMDAPLNVSSIPASESELGFGFHPQEGFSSTTGIPSLSSSSPSAPSEQQQQQQTSQEQPEQRIYAQDTSTEQYQYPPGYEERQQLQQEAQPAQQQNHHTTPLSLKQQRKLTYLDPLPLEHAPRIERDGSLWKTACKLRVFELLRHYPPDIIRSVVAQDAHAYYSARDTFPLGYNMSESERRRLLYKKLGLVSLRNTRSKLYPHQSLPTSPKSPKAKSEGEGEEGDENEFMVERCYSFELTDDDMDEGNLDWEGYVDEEDVDMDLEDEDEDAEEDGWDEEDTDDETDEDEEVEIELKGLVGKKGAAAAAPSGSATGPAEKLTSLDDGILSGDEDAEGEMEVDIEAFSDPSFNAELSSPTSVSSPVAPLPPVESMISSFYIPPAPSVVPFPGAGFFSSGFPQQPQQQQQQQPQQLQQEEGHEQTSLDEPFPLQEVQQNDQQQKQHRHPPPPLQIQIAPANQGGFFASPPPPPSPILPLPPPRLETIRVGYLRQSELGVKVTGKGTPADRSRAAQWAKGFVGGKRRSSRERESEVEENEEGEKRGRPRLRMTAFASEKCVGDAPPSVLGSRTNNMGGLRLSLPSDVGVSPSPPPTSVVVDSVKCADTLDESDFGLKMGVHEVALPPSSSLTSSSVVTPIPAAAVGFVTADDEPHWDAFLASLDEKGGGDKAYQARMPDQLQEQQQQQEALQPELELASTNNNSNPASPSSAPPSPGFTTPRPAAPPPTDPVFGLNTNIFDMSFVLDANSWFGAGASASGSAGLGESPAASSVGDGQPGAIDVASAAVGGTSTLSFALG